MSSIWFFMNFMTCTDSWVLHLLFCQERTHHTVVKRRSKRRRKRSVAPPPAIQPRPPCNWPCGVLISARAHPFSACRDGGAPADVPLTSPDKQALPSTAEPVHIFALEWLRQPCDNLGPSHFANHSAPIQSNFYAFLCCCCFFFYVSLLHAGWIWVTHYLI